MVEIRTKITVGENCALLGNYAGSSGSFIPTSRDKLSVPPSGVKNPLTPEGGTEVRPETSVRNYHYSLRDDPEAQIPSALQRKPEIMRRKL